MGKAEKRRSAKKKLPVEEAVAKILAMMEKSAKHLLEPERTAMLAKIRKIAADTLAESHRSASKQKHQPAKRSSSRRRIN